MFVWIFVTRRWDSTPIAIPSSPNATDLQRNYRIRVPLHRNIKKPSPPHHHSVSIQTPQNLLQMYLNLLILVPLLLKGEGFRTDLSTNMFSFFTFSVQMIGIYASDAQNPWFILSTAAPTSEITKEARKLTSVEAAAASIAQNPWFILSTAAPTTTA